jgi:glycosyltransferase involved in cell wall biosynthesis
MTKQHLIDAGSQKNIEIINPFIDVQLVQSFKRNLKEINSSFCWVMAGSIDANKNPQLFIDIAKEAKIQNLNYKFIWLFHSISDTILYSSITKQLLTEDLPVQFIQTNTYEDYLTQFSNTDGLLLTSTFESFSLVTLEALALSMPIVVNACGGVSEMLNENVASIIPLQSNINYYLTAMKLEESRGMTLASEKNQIAQAFDKKMILEKWEKLLLSESVY